MIPAKSLSASACAKQVYCTRSVVKSTRPQQLKFCYYQTDSNIAVAATMPKKKRVVLAVHGGAGIILRSALTTEMEAAYRSALRDALEKGYAVLTRNRDDATKNKSGQDNVAKDAVEAAVRCMEDCPLFNAGKGSVFANDEQIRCDASIMSCSSFDGAASDNLDTSSSKVEDDNTTSDDNVSGNIKSIQSCHQVIQKRRYPKTPLPLLQLATSKIQSHSPKQ
jgi:hypothetical protein